MVVTILVFLLILSVLVLIHEAGHFFVAKKLGVKVEEFGFGFPPRVFGKKIGETIYSINLLPIGGFVKLYGEDEAGGGKLSLRADSKGQSANSRELREESKLKHDKRSFISRNPWQRAAIIVAGVVMNFLLAVVLISYLFAVQGVPIPGNMVVIAEIAKHSPAEKVGLRAGDIILSVDGNSVTFPEQVITYTKNHLGSQIKLKIRDKGEIKEIVIVPRVHYPTDQGAMGVAISTNVTIKKYPWYQAPFVGTVETLKESWLIIAGIGSILEQLILTRTVPVGVAGPVGIAQLTGQFVQIGFNAVLGLVSALSLNLAILNILPIPALDGGRLFFILIEALTGKKVSQNVENYAHAVGMALLLTLIALITFHDIFRIITNQPLIPK